MKIGRLAAFAGAGVWIWCTTAGALVAQKPAAAKKVAKKKVAKKKVAKKKVAKKKAELGCDRSAIRWVLPGQFRRARDRSKKEKRILIIKGISFGVDDAGAKCATTGKW